jgi:23S rRNA C2498 (ribose-2'-O)-methylase RlmM
MTASSEIRPESVLLYCRPGFEKECPADIIEQAGLLGVYGYVKAAEGGGFVRFMPQGEGACERLRQNLRFGDLIFARQLLYVFGSDEGLPAEDRLTPLMDIIRTSGLRFSELFLETADTNEAKSLSTACVFSQCDLGMCRLVQCLGRFSMADGDSSAEVSAGGAQSVHAQTG